MILELDKIPYCHFENDEKKIVPYFRFVNSNGREIDLTQPPYIGELSNDLIGFKWSPITQGQAVQKIVKFEKSMISKKFKVLVSGESERDYYKNLELLLQITDVDINNLKMGRLYVGNYFIECYVVASGKPKRYLGSNKTLVELSVICERGNWQREVTKSFYGALSINNEDIYTGNSFVYPYDYAYDYSAPFNRTYILNESYMDTEFELTFYGAVDNPSITIGGHTYGFTDLSIQNDEYIVVNSKEKTAILYKQNRTTENVFKYRNREFQLYEKIKGGGNTVIIDNDNRVDIKLFYERSEPKWGSETWI